MTRIVNIKKKSTSRFPISDIIIMYVDSTPLLKCFK